jgi:hypothetical protein
VGLELAEHLDEDLDELGIDGGEVSLALVWAVRDENHLRMEDLVGLGLGFGLGEWDLEW